MLGKKSSRIETLILIAPEGLKILSCFWGHTVGIKCDPYLNCKQWEPNHQGLKLRLPILNLTLKKLTMKPKKKY